MQGEEVAGGSLTLLGQDTGSSRVELQHRVSLREGELAIGLLWDVLADSMSGECIACIGDLMVPLPSDMVPRLRKLLGKEIVLTRIEGYRAAPYRPMRAPGWWG